MDNVNIKKNKALPLLALLLVVAGLTMGSICSFAEQFDNDMCVAMHTSVCFTTPSGEIVDGVQTYTLPEGIDEIPMHEVILVTSDGNERTEFLISVNGYSSTIVTIDEINYYIYFTYDGEGEIDTIGYIKSERPMINGYIYDGTENVFITPGSVGYLQVPSGPTYRIKNKILDNIGIVLDRVVSLGRIATITEPFIICQYLEGGDEMTETGIVTQVLGVFSAIGEWFAETIPDMLAVFYSSETGLTILGTLAVCSLAIAVILLVLAWILDFFKFRR